MDNTWYFFNISINSKFVCHKIIKKFGSIIEQVYLPIIRNLKTWEIKGLINYTTKKKTKEKCR